MADRRVGIIMNGVTGRMGMNQHLIRSIAAIRQEGGITLRSGDRLVPDPILVGRNEAKLAALAQTHGIGRWTTDLDAALADPKDELFFDAATTQAARRPAAARHRGRKDTSIAKSRRPTIARRCGRQVAKLARQRPGSSMAWCRTSCSSPACSKLKICHRQRISWVKHPQRARRVRLLGVRGRLAGSPAPDRGTTRRRRAAASSSICSAIGATCSTTSSAPVRKRCRASVPRISRTRVDENGRHLRLRTPMTRRMRRSSSRAAIVAQINSELDHARAPRRSRGHLPCGRHAWARRWPACSGAGPRRG